MCGNIKVERGKEIVKKENWECICRDMQKSRAGQL